MPTSTVTYTSIPDVHGTPHAGSAVVSAEAYTAMVELAFLSQCVLPMRALYTGDALFVPFLVLALTFITTCCLVFAPADDDTSDRLLSSDMDFACQRRHQLTRLALCTVVLLNFVLMNSYM